MEDEIFENGPQFCTQVFNYVTRDERMLFSQLELDISLGKNYERPTLGHMLTSLPVSTMDTRKFCGN